MPELLNNPGQQHGGGDVTVQQTMRRESSGKKSRSGSRQKSRDIWRDAAAAMSVQQSEARQAGHASQYAGYPGSRAATVRSPPPVYM